MRTTHTKRPTDVFKPLRKGDQLRAAYLYGDGHALVSFERYDRDTDHRAAYYKQIDSLGINCHFEGRIVFSQFGGVAWLRAVLACGCRSIAAHEPSVDRGSEASKKRGIAIGYISADTEFGLIESYDFPGLFSGAHTFQPDVKERFEPTAESFGTGYAVAETLITAAPAAEVAP